MLPGGTYMINARAQIIQAQASPIAQLVKCAIAGPDGKTIARTTSQATVPAGATRSASSRQRAAAILSNFQSQLFCSRRRTLPPSSKRPRGAHP